MLLSNNPNPWHNKHGDNIFLPSRAIQFSHIILTFPNLNFKILKTSTLPNSEKHAPRVFLPGESTGNVELHYRRVKPVSKSGVLWLAWLACLCVSPPSPLLISQGARRGEATPVACRSARFGETKVDPMTVSD